MSNADVERAGDYGWNSYKYVFKFLYFFDSCS